MLFKEKERTYEFSLEGFAEAKAERGTILNFMEDYHTELDILAFLAGMVILYGVVCPLTSIVAYKTLTVEQVAFKMLTTGL